MNRFLLFCIFPLFFIACFDDKKQDSKHTSVSQVKQSNTDPNKNTLENVSSSTTTKAAPLPNAEVLYGKCAACHGKDGKSVAPGSVGNVLIASLNKAQVTESLKGFRDRTLSKGGNSVIMYMQAKNLSDQDIEALANYIDAF
ncbi:c-type cytochrome [Helicobacter sp. MIT 21-1697]|uniref:c-type cytochrome n=1 Tax=Helicobacter sp. MIT 21-1697 TaxID=2993733 RepID=UPI00224A977D|nr:c-type cytochrome [Helicobacter sp. MIT 21-1697]MCX2716473.1 c-type cytochrome [Helicobacter sp. MIT 21-1697]